MIVHVSGLGAVDRWARDVPDSARQLAQRFWPGPLTLVLNRSGLATDAVTGGQDTVALRAPANTEFQAVLADLADRLGPDVGIAAPSANRFGRVSPTTAQHVVDELGDHLLADHDVILDAGESAIGLESTIVSCTGAICRIARTGGITREQLALVVDIASEPAEERVPGALASHYAPRARVVLATGEQIESLDLGPSIGLLALASVGTPPGWQRLSAPNDVDDYAHTMYSALRAADQRGLTVVVAVPPPPRGIGAAIQDRLSRASFPARS